MKDVLMVVRAELIIIPLFLTPLFTALLRPHGCGSAWGSLLTHIET